MSPRITINTVPYAFRAGGIDSQAFAPSAATGGRMFYDTGTGVLKYFDGIANSWRALDASSTLQTVTTLGNTTTRDIQFAGGTSTAAFTIQSSLTVTGQTSSTSLLFVNATGTNTTSTNLFGSVLGFTTGNGTNLTTTNATTTNIAVTGGASANFNPLVDALLSLGSPALRWNGNFANTTSTNATTTNLAVTGLFSMPAGSAFNATNITWTNATGTNTTSTSLGITGLSNLTTLLFTNGTGTTLNLSNNLTVGGTSVCLRKRHQLSRRCHSGYQLVL